MSFAPRIFSNKNYGAINQQIYIYIGNNLIFLCYSHVKKYVKEKYKISNHLFQIPIKKTYRDCIKNIYIYNLYHHGTIRFVDFCWGVWSVKLDSY